MGEEMLTTEEVTISFKSDLDKRYRERLDRLFFFNRNQPKYVKRINQSIDEYSMPVLKEKEGRVSVVFRDEWLGQSIHILDSERADSELIGVVMYVRDSLDLITIVHMVLDEECNAILRRSSVNVALIILDELIALFRKIKGVSRVRLYYTGKVIRI